MKDDLAMLGGMAFLGAISALGFGLLIIWIRGLSWAKGILLPWLTQASFTLMVMFVLILLPAALFRSTRRYSAIGIVIISYVFGTVLWLASFLIVATNWGLLWAIFGLFVFFTLLPFALFAALFEGSWNEVAAIIVLTIVTFGGRVLGASLGTNATKV